MSDVPDTSAAAEPLLMSGHHEHGPAAPTTLAAWISAMSRTQPSDSGRFLSHSPTCAGCGTENPAGLALQVDATEAGVRCVHRFDHRQEGAPGIIPGGLVAAAFDDLFGFLSCGVPSPALGRAR